MAVLGFLLVDKPKDVTSFFVVTTLRKILGIRRIGFAGTLDPLATGLMIVAVGEATKLLNALEQMDKVYDVTVRFGAVSDTCDAEGPLHDYPNPAHPTRARIESAVEEHFSGERQQIPPRYSAVKIKGQRAYALARKGQHVELPSKKVFFHDVKIKSFSWPDLHATLHCGSGTYIRSFAHDLGQLLKCGGYVQELRRTKIASFPVKNAVPLAEITALNCRKILLKPEEFLKDWQQCLLDEDEYRQLCHGAFIANKGGLRPGPILGIYKGETVGLLETVNKDQLKFAKKFN